MFIAILQIVLVTWFYTNTAVVYSCLIILSLLLLWQFEFKRPYVLMFLLTGLSGFVGEAIVVQKEAWVYSTQDFVGLPYWLFLLWGSVGVACMHFGNKFIQRYEK